MLIPMPAISGILMIYANFLFIFFAGNVERYSAGDKKALLLKAGLYRQFKTGLFI